MHGRDALKSLLDDVISGRADFQVILVYDVSRWGRFQDSDESACYEFICKSAGIAVEYCAEQFENDGSLTATILKNIKRAMAGEYSRELSVKTFAGQARIAAMGFNVGSSGGYGLRRMLLDESGNQKMQLLPGQRKNTKSERVILVPGPPHEIETVRHVYDLFLDQKMSLKAITALLNHQGIANARGCHWTSMAIYRLLTHEKYAGTNVYGQTSKKFSANWMRKPRHEWIRAEGAFEEIVSKQRFLDAQCRLRENAGLHSDNEMLDFLTALWCHEGSLSGKLVDSSSGAPSLNSFRRHFGSLRNAFQRIGFKNKVLANRELGLKVRKIICNEVIERMPHFGGSARLLQRNSQLVVNEELTVSIVTGRTAPSNGSRNYKQWQFGYRSQRKPDILIVVRVDKGSTRVLDYYFLPFSFLPGGSWLTVSGINHRRLEGFRTDSLNPFFELCARESLEVRHA